MRDAEGATVRSSCCWHVRPPQLRHPTSSIAHPARAEAAGFALSGGRSVVVEATVVGKIEVRTSGEWAFDAVARRVGTGAVSEAVRFDISVRVQPSEVDGADELDVGAVVELRGTAGRLRSAIAPCSRSPRRAA